MGVGLPVTISISLLLSAATMPTLITATADTTTADPTTMEETTLDPTMVPTTADETTAVETTPAPTMAITETTPSPTTATETPDPTTEETTVEITTTDPPTTEPEPTTKATTTTAKTTMTTTTAATTTIDLVTKIVAFRSLLTAFTADLLNSSSTAFKTRAALIESQLGPLFKANFNSFVSLIVTSFRNGSIINTMNVKFVATSVPTDTLIRNVLISASSSVTGFDIEASSITIDGSSSSGVSHKISLVTAFCPVLLSWLLSNQQ